MAIAIDPSSPAITAVATTDRTTAAFSPPAGTVLVAIAGTEYSFEPGTLSDTGTGLSWSKVVNRFAEGNPWGSAEIWVARNASAQSGITVTYTGAGGGFAQVLRVYVVTGADPDDWVGNSASGGATTSNLSVTSAFTATAAGSVAFIIANDGNGAGVPTIVGDVGDTYNSSSSVSGAIFRKASPSLAAGAAVGFSVTASGSRAWNWGAVEILAAPEPRHTVLRPTSAVHRAASW